MKDIFDFDLGLGHDSEDEEVENLISIIPEIDVYIAPGAEKKYAKEISKMLEDVVNELVLKERMRIEVYKEGTFH